MTQTFPLDKDAVTVLMRGHGITPTPQRLEIAQILFARPQHLSAEQVLGPVDALKLRSCVTLFGRADPGQPAFGQVLERYFGGVPDAATEALL